MPHDQGSTICFLTVCREKTGGRRAIRIQMKDVTEHITIGAVQLLKTGYDGEIGEGFMSAGLETKVIYPGVNADSTRYPLYSICCTGEAT